MKDRQFMMMLGLVVAAGLVIGLVAFRVTGKGAPAGVTANATAATTNLNDGQPHPSAADSEPDQPADSVPQSGVTGGSNGEPAPPSGNPASMQGPANGDPPGTAAVAVPPQAAPADTSDSAPATDSAPASSSASSLDYKPQ